MTEETANQARSQTKCPSCGGEMVFDPEHQTLHCAYCGKKAAVTVQTGAILEYDFKTAENTANLDWGAVKKVIHCHNCGAETVVDGSSVAAECAFCGSSHIIDQESSAGIAPESLVPFKVSKNTAEENFSQWIRKRFFAPRALKKNYRREAIAGVYVPFWTYDADSETEYWAEAGTYYYTTEKYTVKKEGKTETRERRVRHTRWRPVNGHFARNFDDFLVNASRQVDDKLIRKIEPFDLKELVQYQAGFLAGFTAERYSVGLKEGWEKAQQEMEKQLRDEITRHIAADEVRRLSLNTVFRNIRFKHILLPVWVSTYLFNNKVYKFLVNGQTGKVHGEAPVSFWKVAGLIAAVLALIAVLIIIFS
ncbi:MAG: hypothetical protein GX044_10380 [Firmicutes bacterium]|jgi:ribosomal protein S27E|nr:hypothetical protein [Bacillota bacterium]